MYGSGLQIAIVNELGEIPPHIVLENYDDEREPMFNMEEAPAVAHEIVTAIYDTVNARRTRYETPMFDFNGSYILRASMVVGVPLPSGDTRYMTIRDINLGRAEPASAAFGGGGGAGLGANEMMIMVADLGEVLFHAWYDFDAQYDGGTTTGRPGGATQVRGKKLRSGLPRDVIEQDDVSVFRMVVYFLLDHSAVGGRGMFGLGFSGENAGVEEDEHGEEVKRDGQGTARAYRRASSLLQRRAYNTFDDRLLSFYYSDFARLPVSPSYTYGVCVLEALEYIRLEGEMELQRVHFFKRFVNYEAFFNRIRLHGFDYDDLQKLSEGDITYACELYKRHFTHMNFGLYITHTDTIYGVDDETGRLRELKAQTERGPLQQVGAFYPLTFFNLFPWWLVYERMHVVPMKTSQILEFNARNKKSMRKFNHVRQFIAPLNDDEKMEVRTHADTWKMRASEFGTKPSETTYFLSRCVDVANLRAKFDAIVDKRRVAGVESTDEVADFQKFLVEHNYSLDTIDGGAHLESYREKRHTKIERTGVIAIDAETFVENALDAYLYGNVQPFMICVHGYAYIDRRVSVFERDRIDEVRAEAHNEKYVKRIDIEGLTFAGVDCADQFVRWIINYGIIRMLPIPCEQGRSSHGSTKNYIRDFKNIFIAHNGAKFDYRFLFTKLTQYAHMEVVGSKTQIKKIRFRNVEFVDTVYLLPFSLAKLCKTFKTRNQKFPYDIENVGKDTWEQKYAMIQKYCLMDCRALHEVYMKYIRARATTYFNNTAFAKKVFPMTQSYAALDVLSSCYLQRTLSTYAYTIAQERESYFGGSVQAFDLRASFAVTYDINSSYPASMHNKMPVRPLADEDTNNFIRDYNYYLCCDHSPLSELCGGDSERRITRVKNTDLYEVTFRFPAHVVYPSLTIRLANGTLINAQSSQAERVWIWGVQLNFAAQRYDALIRIYRRIHYEEEDVFRTFVEDMYAMRKQAVRDGNPVMDVLLKLLMNSSYGKLGQKLNPMSFYGTLQEVCDFVESAETRNEGFAIVGMEHVLNLNTELYELRYICDGHEYSQIGGLVRFASYICALSRTNLYRMIQHVHNVLGRDYPQQMCVTYVDTDSVAVRVCKGFARGEEDRYQLRELYAKCEEITHVSEKLQQQVTAYEKYCTLKREQLLEEEDAVMEHYGESGDLQHDKARIENLKKLCEEYFEKIRAIFAENEFIQRIERIQDFDARDMSALELEWDEYMRSETMMRVLDANICGAFKQEKYVWEGYFLGAKFYATKCLELKNDGTCGGALQRICKMKGVQERKRIYEDYRTMYEAIFSQGDYDVFTSDDLLFKYVRMIDYQQFRVLDSGVRIRNVFKFLLPTLTKRIYECTGTDETTGEKRWISRAYSDMVECFAMYARVSEVNAQAREKFKRTIARPLLEERLQSEETGAQYKDNLLRVHVVDKNRNRALQVCANEEDRQAKLRIVQPVFFTKMNFLNIVGRQLGAASGETLNSDLSYRVVRAFQHSLRFFLDLFGDIVVSSKCKKVERYREVIRASYFLDALCDLMTNDSRAMHTFVEYLTHKRERFVEKYAIRAKSYFSLNEEVTEIVIKNFQEATTRMHEALRARIYAMCETTYREQITHLERDTVEEHVERFAREKLREIRREMDGNARRKYDEDYLGQFIWIRATLVFALKMGKGDDILAQFMQESHNHRSRYRAILNVIRTLVNDYTALRGTWDSQGNYSKLSQRIKNFLDYLDRSFFAKISTRRDYEVLARYLRASDDDRSDVERYMVANESQYYRFLARIYRSSSSSSEHQQQQQLMYQQQQSWSSSSSL